MKTGRPRLLKSERKGQITGVRLTDEERKIWELERLGNPEGVYFLPYISRSP